ncbi:MAG: cyoE [Cytophagaceae bacterium]|jgi:protoheme IX farnesyltransferase|nr:cyoE [Cytophagaceae bacterium]
MSSNSASIGFMKLLSLKTGAYVKLLKMRLTLLVSFSAAFGYLVTGHSWYSTEFIWFMLGGFLVIGASNIINQIWEKNTDALMSRTHQRPLVTGVVSVNEAIVFTLLLAATGLGIFVFKFNLNAAFLSLVSLLLYAFAYTPLKIKSPIAVFVGAIPGALPPMIGWVAATGQYGWEPGILFAIQFFWQFPHFWAIAWVLDEDYKKAGIKLLPSAGGRDMKTAFNIMIYTLLLIPLGFMPYLIGMTGINSALVAMVAGILFLAQTFYLMREGTNKAAKLIMFGSFLYLPIVQIAYLLDKI